jgi:UDP-N-acetylglucosamine acyltransferase
VTKILIRQNLPLLHPHAIIDPSAILAPGVEVGPFCVVGPHVVLEENVKLHAHVVVTGRTTIGEGTEVFPFASLGAPPQDLKYAGENSTLTIGKRNVIREYVTMQPGTEAGGLETIVGDHGLFMASSHVAHDCRLGDRVILANSVALGGHVVLENDVIIGGLTGVHQWVHIGQHAMVGGTVGLTGDVIPYGCVAPDGFLASLNFVGLKRRGFDKETLQKLKSAYEILFEKEDARPLTERAATMPAELKSLSAVQNILSFLSRSGGRRLCLPREV